MINVGPRVRGSSVGVCTTKIPSEERFRSEVGGNPVAEDVYGVLYALNRVNKY